MDDVKCGIGRYGCSDKKCENCGWNKNSPVIAKRIEKMLLELSTRPTRGRPRIIPEIAFRGNDG